MKKYQIIDYISGQNINTYNANDVEEALDIIAQDKGYEDYVKSPFILITIQGNDLIIKDEQC